MTSNKEIEHSKLSSFFIITFGYSWFIWGIGVLLSCYAEGDLSMWIVMPIIIIGAFGPFMGAVWSTYRSEGREEVKSFLRRGLKISDVPVMIWLATFLIPICTMLVTIFFVRMKFGVGGLSLNGLLLFPFYIILMYLGGPLQEEYGWRGYALDRLQSKWSALTSSIILGIVWAVWHLPLFYIKGTHQQNMDMVVFLISTVMLAIIMTWLYNNTQGNIFIAMTFHSVGNAVIIIVDTEGVSAEVMHAGELYNAIAIMVVALMLVIIWGPKSMTRFSAKSG